MNNIIMIIIAHTFSYLKMDWQASYYNSKGVEFIHEPLLIYCVTNSLMMPNQWWNNTMPFYFVQETNGIFKISSLWYHAITFLDFRM